MQAPIHFDLTVNTVFPPRLQSTSPFQGKTIKRSICAWLVLAGTLLTDLPASAESSIVLHHEAPSASEMETRTYAGLNEAFFIPLCESFLEKEGWTISVVSPEMGLLRAWRTTSLESAAKKLAGVLVPTICSEKRTVAVITVNPQSGGVAVRGQFTYQIYDQERRMSEQGVVSTPENYTQFFDKLDAAITAAQRS